MLEILAQVATNTNPNGGAAVAGGGILFGGFFCFVICIGIAALIFWIISLVDAIKNPNLTSDMRIIWVLVIIFTGIIGSLIYYLAGRNGNVGRS